METHSFYLPSPPSCKVFTEVRGCNKYHLSLTGKLQTTPEKNNVIEETLEHMKFNHHKINYHVKRGRKGTHKSTFLKNNNHHINKPNKENKTNVVI